MKLITSKGEIDMEKRITLSQLKKMVKESTEPVEFSLFDKSEVPRLNSMYPVATISMEASRIEDLDKEKLDVVFKRFTGHMNYAYCIWIDEE